VNDDFVAIDDVDLNDVDSALNETNESSSRSIAFDFSSFFDFDLSNISSLDFDFLNLSLSSYFESRSTLSQSAREKRRRASTQYEERTTYKRRK
jgi:hypothetical protein